MCTTPLLSWSSTGRGVPAGAYNPYELSLLNPGTTSTIAGTFGNIGERRCVVTPNACNRPSLIKGSANVIFAMQ